MNKSLALAATLLVTACYGAAPPHPATIPLPPMASDTIVDVHTVSKTEIENVAHKSSTCPQGHAEGDPACVVTTYTVAEPVTRTHTTASLDGQPLSIGQFRVLTDRDYDKKLERLADLSHQCSRANTPRYIGMGLVIGGLVLMGAAGSIGKGIMPVAYGSMIGGGVAYGFGYYGYGGRACNEANALFHSIDYAAETGFTTIEGVDEAHELAELAARFNEGKRRAAATPAAAAPSSPTPTATPTMARPSRGGGGRRSLRIR
jgi:hypothetical protein